MNALSLVFVLPLVCCTVVPPDREQVPAAETAVKSGFDHSHKIWTELLAKHVHGDTFDYKALKKEPAALNAYLASLEAVKPDDFERWSKLERHAFWIDAYNAYTIKRVVDAYPIASIKDLGDDKVSVWDREFIALGSLAPDLKKTKLTLNDIEHKILRPVFKDARVHAAVNCASVGCPPLRNEAFVADRLDKQLDDSTKRWLADTRRNRFDARKNVVEVSQVFDWFKDDFVRDANSVHAWIAKYAPLDQAWIAAASKLEIKYLDYSWKLNETP